MTRSLCGSPASEASIRGSSCRSSSASFSNSTAQRRAWGEFESGGECPLPVEPEPHRYHTCSRQLNVLRRCAKSCEMAGVVVCAATWIEEHCL